MCDWVGLEPMIVFKEEVEHWNPVLVLEFWMPTVFRLTALRNVVAFIFRC